ncbi:unnamed protein product [Ectocarpus sp. 8 AP-2014]
MFFSSSFFCFLTKRTVVLVLAALHWGGRGKGDRSERSLFSVLVVYVSLFFGRVSVIL